MTEAPTKKKRKDEEDNIFMAMIYYTLIQLPAILISWIISRFDWD
jgi:hypothetical protein